MTSPSSSTSSSSAGAYLAAFAAVVLALSAAAALLSWTSLRGMVAGPLEVELFRRQIGKLDAAPALDTVFLGDSSLGNAIDAGVWRDLAGRPTLNLALTGAYGYAGTRNMLRHVLQRGRPRTVIVMQTLDMMTREPSELGDLYTSLGLDDAGLGLGGFFRVYLNLTTVRTALAGWAGRLMGAEEDGLAPGADYVPQGARLDPATLDRLAAEEPIEVEAIRPEAAADLRAIAALCRANGVACVYVHGPTYAAYCRTAGDYLKRVDAIIEAAGLPVPGSTPLCMKPADVGNTLDHVRPGRKAAFTRLHHEVLRRFGARGVVRAAATDPRQPGSAAVDGGRTRWTVTKLAPSSSPRIMP